MFSLYIFSSYIFKLSYCYVTTDNNQMHTYLPFIATRLFWNKTCIYLYLQTWIIHCCFTLICCTGVSPAQGQVITVPSSFLIRPEFWTLHKPCGLSLDPLWCLNVLYKLRGGKTECSTWSMASPLLSADDQFPVPSGYAVLDIDIMFWFQNRGEIFKCMTLDSLIFFPPYSRYIMFPFRSLWNFKIEGIFLKFLKDKI